MSSSICFPGLLLSRRGVTSSGHLLSNGALLGRQTRPVTRVNRTLPPSPRTRLITAMGAKLCTMPNRTYGRSCHSFSQRLGCV